MEKPKSSDCCGSGCVPCVFDVYESSQRRQSDRAVDSQQRSRELRHDLLSPLRYKPFVFLSRTKVGRTIGVYAFRPAVDDETADTEVNIGGILPYCPGQHFIMVDAKNDFAAEREWNVSRSYTPISIADDETNCVVKFVIKLYDSGRMSSFISRLQPRDVVFFRGPFGNFRHVRDSSYVMICAGVGLAPVYPIVRSVLADEGDETTMRLHLVCATLDDVPMRDDIREFAGFWNFVAYVYLSRDEEDSSSRWRDHVRWDENVRAKRIDADIVRDELRDRKSSKVLICGSESFGEDVRGWAERCGVEKTNIFVF